MLQRVFVGLVLSGATTIFVACASTNDGGAPGFDGGAAALPLSNQGADFVAACKSMASANCALYQKCAPIAFRIIYADMNDCEVQNTNVCTYYGSYPEVGITAASVNACAATYQQASCVQLYQPYPCGVDKGPRPLGAPCGVNAQCETGVCLLSSIDCGTCTTPSGPGESCVTQTCDNAQGLECIGQRCIKPIPANASCLSSSICADGLVCVNRMCAEGGGMGDACSVDIAPCNSHLGLACDPTSMKCVAATFSAAGETCQTNGPQFCADSVCVPNAGDGGTAACVPFVPENGACGASLSSLCIQSLLCVEGSCKNLPMSSSCH